MTLVPRSHADVLADLGPREGAAVLAGLSRVSLALRKEEARDELSVRAHPVVDGGRPGHLHFHVG